MKYKFSTKDIELKEVVPVKKTQIELIKEKLSKIEYVVLVHHIKEIVKKELKVKK